ncbi:MAG TPA: TonB-dependent receptor [Vicinamibacterales bacterium]|nr:TonB-dependent receptor [Vicinamibacterales bacterium]
MRNVWVGVLALLVTVVGPLAAHAANDPQGDTGRVSGTVIDQLNGMRLPGVTVQVSGGRQATTTDMDGRFGLELPRDRIELTILLDGYAERRIVADLREQREVQVDVALGLAGYSELVTVTAQATDAETSSAAAQLIERQRAGAITDNLGAQDMKANADSDAAAALQRVTGLSLVDNQYVFVRGLGERYSNTTLNGATIPSTEPERKVVSLDIFPAGLLDNVTVVKSYTPDRSAEFAGGLVEIVPARLPRRPVLDLSYQVGANSQTSGEPVFDHPAGDRDWLGLSNADRTLPGIFPERRVIRGGIYTPDLGIVDRAEIERLGESLSSVWQPRAADGRLNQGFSAAFGNRWGRVGVLASVNQSYRHRYLEEDQTYYRVEESEGLTTFSDYDYRSAASTGSLAAVLGVGGQITAQHRASAQFFTTSRGERETRTFEGFNADAGRNLRNARLLWREENLRTAQVGGDHLFPGLSNSSLEWRVSASTADRDEPDLRETLYEEVSGRFQLADESQSGLRMFNDLDEDTVDVRAGWSVFFPNWAGLPTMLKGGPAYARRQRDFASRRFRFVPLDIRGFDLTRQPEEIFTPENIGRYFELREETRPTDFYDAEQTTTAFYGMADVPLSARWRLVGGLRVETFTLRVTTFDLFDTDAATIDAEIDETDLFPAVNLVFSPRRDQNLRFGFSQTVNRPEFRELAPFEFTDIVGGRAVVGNPELTQALIRNYDLRWELFPGAEQLVAASFFYKDFSDPIERFVEPTAQLRTSFTNARSARNLGFELEARQLIGRHALAGANYTFVDSEIRLDEFQTNVLTTLQRPLAGTSRHVFNGLLEVRAAGASARLLLNYFGDRIADVGSLGLPDIVEAGRPTLDFALSQRLGRIHLRLAAENLTDEPITFTQGGEPQRRFTVGRTLLLQFGYSAF